MQRPYLSGALSGLIGTIPSLAILHALGSLQVEAIILGHSQLITVVAGELVMACAGAVYSRVFGRAANNVRGGWLFGMMFGFILWAAGAVMILPLASDGRIPAGVPGIGVLLSLLLWGATTGVAQPFIQRPLHESIEAASRRDALGPSAALMNRRR
jgi:hypothetical protein